MFWQDTECTGFMVTWSILANYNNKIIHCPNGDILACGQLQTSSAAQLYHTLLPNCFPSSFFPNIFSYFPQNTSHRKHIRPAEGINHRCCISGLRACLLIYCLWCLENACVWLPRPSRWWFLELFFILVLSSCLLHFVLLLHCSTLFFSLLQ